ncbi:hypothetical protein ECTOBSL9_3005 [Ectothiorhodospira sp. BSL-9]|nr:hypothetical protein ECTOBSL9_3005 [Ectothiorhodospira sp. BSL-9]
MGGRTSRESRVYLGGGHPCPETGGRVGNVIDPARGRAEGGSKGPGSGSSGNLITSWGESWFLRDIEIIECGGDDRM